jgi:hypothetical protein
MVNFDLDFARLCIAACLGLPIDPGGSDAARKMDKGLVPEGTNPCIDSSAVRRSESRRQSPQLAGFTNRPTMPAEPLT